MRIVWQPNPMRTRVELDEADKRVFRLSIKVEELEERLSSAHFDLDPAMREWAQKALKRDESLEACVERARYHLRSATEEGEKALEERVDMLLSHFLEELAGEHDGDCTCVPCSCSKCHAESLLGIDTIEGLGKHPGSKISGMFRARPGEPEPTIDEVIEKLRNYAPVNTSSSWPDEDFQKHVPRWIEEAKHAHAWLLNYKMTKLEVK